MRPIPLIGHHSCWWVKGPVSARAHTAEPSNILSRPFFGRAWPLLCVGQRMTSVYPDGSLASDVEMRPIRIDFGANETCGRDYVLMGHSGGQGMATKAGQQKPESAARKSGKLF